MTGTFDRGEGLARRVQCIHVGSGETYRGGVVLGALDHEHGYREFAAEKLPIKLVEMRDEALAAYALSVEPVVDIGDRGASARGEKTNWTRQSRNRLPATSNFPWQMIEVRRASHGWTARRGLIPVRQAIHPSGQKSLSRTSRPGLLCVPCGAS